MKKSALFLPASIRSHMIPALFLANLLRDEYDVYFAVTSGALEDIVVKHGYKAIRTGKFRVALGMEPNYVYETKGRPSKWDTLRSIWNNDLYRHRKKELFEIIDQINPEVAFIDIFNSTETLILYPHFKNIKLFFLNPMLSTYRVNGFPTVSQGYWPSSGSNEKNANKGEISLSNILRRPIESLITASLNRQFKILSNLGDLASKHPVSADKTVALLFDNIPEIILAPLELEMSEEVRRPNQHYLGLCINENRTDTELDPSFEQRFSQILEGKRSDRRKKLIYCSFGTFYQGSDKRLLDFLSRLLDAIVGLENVEAIFSVNNLVIETLVQQNRIQSKHNLFTRVPQLRVLEHADVFITHGGLGSVKESIFFGVPMLVYPLDPNYDQNGNGLKVEHHGLGLRGIFHSERPLDMKVKLEELLGNNNYRTSLLTLKSKCSRNYPHMTLNENVKFLISQNNEIDRC
jgi:UDP:flavonoid glycosyltransferase YjiC (YdhE family)